jgi:hypothetical protein
MKRIWWILGLGVVLGPLAGLDLTHAQSAAGDTSRAIARPNAALLMRLARARQLSNCEPTLRTLVGTCARTPRAPHPVAFSIMLPSP